MARRADGVSKCSDGALRSCLNDARLGLAPRNKPRRGVRQRGVRQWGIRKGEFALRAGNQLKLIVALIED